ncbi:hypothetical protein, partial [Klebsiella pneumoniae]|uniref:hypothetical protein n=1 Tax=Klebsiella pneumoniae TaxID=573 RepID=UPI003AF42394
MIDGEENPDLLQNYLNNYSFVSSRVNAYRFLTDNQITGNPYQVCNKAQIDVLYDNYFIRGEGNDARKDAVKRTVKKGSLQ